MLVEEQDIFNNINENRENQKIKNKYYFGDNLDLLNYLKKNQPISKPRLIYIDPPYMSKVQYRSVVKGIKNQPSFNRVAFDDHWENNIDNYLNMLYPRLQIMQQILHEKGSIFVHVDWHVSHYVRLLLDEIFGRSNFINEIVWCYSGGSNARKHLQRKHDTIFWYAHSGEYTYNPQYRPYTQGTLERGLTAVKGPTYSLSAKGASLQDWWTDINKILSPTAYENLKYPTQKPRELLKRLITMASNPGDLIADFFAGSGTTAEVCNELDRNWILCDNSQIAMQTIFKRLIKNCSPFSVYTSQISLVTQAEEQKTIDLTGKNPILQIRIPKIQTNGPDNYWLSIGIEYYQPEPIPDDWDAIKFASCIEFWEIDTDYDQHIFESQYQVIRSRKQASIDLDILLSVPRRSSYTLAIKVYDYYANQVINIIKYQPEQL